MKKLLFGIGIIIGIVVGMISFPPSSFVKRVHDSPRPTLEKMVKSPVVEDFQPDGQPATFRVVSKKPRPMVSGINQVIVVGTSPHPQGIFVVITTREVHEGDIVKLVQVHYPYGYGDISREIIVVK